ncbi:MULTISPECIES: hypothetical protein [unclassified Roseofilum]|uniref:hypothetical protein n=1 Tax=unclassified Roseofilum TaxID=2620099 RepID=UPI001B0D2AE7|nr:MULTISPECIES: hypothetical protein [unclassified Roseofilum]MBP0007175.1 hypothetical protein [Roseofilum sp. Belize Diploria]MBP0031818.1 hypothetical protein [Roseofilum sp. Belize BBD 4]
MNPPMMQSALRISTKVLPGDKVEIQVPSGSEGQEVDVFVVFSHPAPSKRSSFVAFIEELQNRHPKRSVEEINYDLMMEGLNHFNTSLTPEERTEKWLTFVQGLPEKSSLLPDEALHRDSMYD